MSRIFGLFSGAFLGMVLAVLPCGWLMYDDLRASDGLAPGFSWLILINISGMGTLVGAIVGWQAGPCVAKRLNASDDRSIGVSGKD
jgi:hypothetical protein